MQKGKKNKIIKKWNRTPSKLRVLGDTIAMDQAIHIVQELFSQIANSTFFCTRTAGLYFTPPFPEDLINVFGYRIPANCEQR
jgi:hypothetical protein